MADRVRVSDLDFVFISFNEPNKEQNWADLKSKVPWAKRVDGVVGFDSAHKAAAEKAETDPSQRGQVSSGNGRGRLSDQAAQFAAVFGARR